MGVTPERSRREFQVLPRQPRSAQILTADSVQQKPIAASGDQRSTTESTEIHGKENPNQLFPFRVLPCFPWLPVCNDLSCRGNRSVTGIHSDPRPFDPLGQLADVDLILLGRVSLLRILFSVISGHPKGRSVVPRSSCLPESSPRLSAPARPRGRGRLAQFRLPQRFAVWWVAPPWPILPVPAVLLALCRVVD